jgi:flagellin
MTIGSGFSSDAIVNLLGRSSNHQQSIIEKLTSGLAINHAADNASGLAVVTGMTTQLRAYTQGVQNANDGMALIQTADGASSQVQDILQRQRELAVQSLNGTYNAADRTKMDAEFQQLTTEINRISTTTEFNKNPLLAGMTATGSVVSMAPAAIKIHTGNGALSVTLDNLNAGVSGAGGALGQVAYRSSNGVVSMRNSAFSRATIGTQTAASLAIMKIDSALSNMSNVRAKWGAVQSRLEHSVANLNNINTNTGAARSQIWDTDYAKAMANLTREQFLQQAGVAMLMQRNHDTQNVLSLLR